MIRPEPAVAGAQQPPGHRGVENAAEGGRRDERWRADEWPRPPTAVNDLVGGHLLANADYEEDDNGEPRPGRQ